MGLRAQSRLNVDHARNNAAGWTFGITGVVRVDGVPTTGIIVELYLRSTGVLIARSSTDANGFYQFLALTQGAPYTIVALNPSAPPTTNAQVIDWITPAWMLRPGVDPYWSSTKAVLFNDSAVSGTTTFLDQSTSALAFTRQGSAAYSNTTAPPGLSTSVAMGTNSGLTLAANAYNSVTTGDYCVESYTYHTSDINTLQTYFDFRSTPADTTNEVGFISAGAFNEFWLNATKVTGSGIAAAAWYHWAIVRWLSVTTLYINGTATGSIANTQNWAGRVSAIGLNVALGGGILGFMAAFRFTQFARYQANFIPPTLPLPVVGP